MKINYRFPHEFVGYGNTWKIAIRLWAFHYWIGNNLDIDGTKGFRILGLEFVVTAY